MPCILVDWIGDRTPPGSSALRESEASAAKRPVGTEINHTLWYDPIL
ncbi:hypothetical protein [Lysinibacillus xylanilyticus]